MTPHRRRCGACWRWAWGRVLLAEGDAAGARARARLGHRALARGRCAVRGRPSPARPRRHAASRSVTRPAPTSSGKRRATSSNASARDSTWAAGSAGHRRRSGPTRRARAGAHAFMFTDVVGLHAACRCARRRRLVRSSCAGTTTRCGPVSGSTGARSSTATGDGFFVAFESALLQPSPGGWPSSRRSSSTDVRAASPCRSGSASTARSPTDKVTTTVASASMSRRGWRRWPMAARRGHGGDAVGSGGRHDRAAADGQRQGRLRTAVRGICRLAGRSARGRVRERIGTLDPMSAVLPIYFESGSTRVFAGALEWPGWCRSGTVRGRRGRRAAGLHGRATRPCSRRRPRPTSACRSDR